MASVLEWNRKDSVSVFEMFERWSQKVSKVVGEISALHRSLRIGI